MVERKLPEGWSTSTIANIAEVNPKKIEANPDLKTGFVPMSHAPINYHGALEFEEKPWGEINKSYTNFKNNDVIFAKVTPCFENGKAAVVTNMPNGIGAGSSEFYVLRPRNKEIPARYLLGIIKTQKFMQEGAENMTGAVGLRRVPRTFLENFQISLPPLAEQKVIAEKLDTLLAQVDSTKARLELIPQILKRFRQAVLAAAVSGKLTEEWRLLNPLDNVCIHINEIEETKKGHLKVRLKKDSVDYSEIFKLPESWSWIHNYQLAVDNSNAICAGPFGTIFKAKDFRESGIPIIFLRHVKESGFNQRKPNFMDLDVWSEYHKDYSVYGGELLVTKLGDPPGESCIYPFAQGTSMVTPDVLKMNVDQRVAETKYLMYFFNSPVTKELIKKSAFGATRLRIDIAMFKNFPVPLPPLEEQTEIVRRVEQLFSYADSIEKQVKNALTRVNNLTQSILAKAFRGELTEQWRAENPDLISGENSAEALLARIKAERESIAPKKASRAKR